MPPCQVITIVVVVLMAMIVMLVMMILSRGEKCKVKLGGREVMVTTHTFTRPGGVAYIASAFIDW